MAAVQAGLEIDWQTIGTTIGAFAAAFWAHSIGIKKGERRRESLPGAAPAEQGLSDSDVIRQGFEDLRNAQAQQMAQLQEGVGFWQERWKECEGRCSQKDKLLMSTQRDRDEKEQRIRQLEGFIQGLRLHPPENMPPPPPPRRGGEEVGGG